MNLPQKIQPFFDAYLASLSLDSSEPEDVEVWHFCDDEASANELGELTRRGVKTATASLFWEYEQTGESLPQVGGLSIITNWDGDPLCIIKTTWISIVTFNSVDADQAYQEGEGDRSLDYWRKVHWRYFAKTCEALSLTPSGEMPVVCEKFKLVYPLPA